MRMALLAALALPWLAACGDKPAPAWSGYVEGDYVYVGAPFAGTITTLAVRRGETVARGAPLFALDAEAEHAARDEARARVEAAQAQAADAGKGRRRDEIAVTQAQRAQAQANATLAAAELARQEQLIAQGFVSPARLDDARAALDQARARLAELDAALRVAQLPARVDTRAAAEAAVQAARETLRQAEWRAQQKQASAPVDAQVADTFHRVGEWAGAGQPVVALLPPGAVKARFFVGEAEIASLAAGQVVSIACDGCGAPIPARIDFIATRAEYTPPVIYSNAQRARLVFLVEARPEAGDAARLRPGQPIDVRRAP